MVANKKTDKEIAELKRQIKQLEAQKKQEAAKSTAMKQVVKDVKALLRANKLSVDDLLAALGGSAKSRAKAPAKRGRKKAAAGRKKAGSKVNIPDIGTYTVSSRGRLPAELAKFVQKNGLSRAELIAKYKAK